VAQCGIDRIHKLLASAGGVCSLAPDDPDKPSVAIVQDLLTGQGEASLSDIHESQLRGFRPAYIEGRPPVPNAE